MYQVYVAHDGCSNWEVDHPDSKGTYEQCLEFISKHLPPKGYDQYFDLVEVGGRASSYQFTPVARRIRLVEQDLKVRK